MVSELVPVATTVTGVGVRARRTAPSRASARSAPSEQALATPGCRLFRTSRICHIEENAKALTELTVCTPSAKTLISATAEHDTIVRVPAVARAFAW